MSLWNVCEVTSDEDECFNEEPAFDEFLYCDNCADFVFEYCSIHGPLLVIPDDKVSSKPEYPSFVPRAALTIPRVFLHLAPSRIPGAGVGVFTTLTLPRGVRFGPYRGRKTNEIHSMYCWQIYDDGNKPSHVVDAADANNSNWMRYVNCARHWREQNLVAYQYRGQLYYRTIKIIPPFTELLVFYGAEYANSLKIDLRRYNTNQFHKLTGSPTASNIETGKTINDDIFIENDNAIQDIFKWYSSEESNTNYDFTSNKNKIFQEYNDNKNHDISKTNTGEFDISERTESRDYLNTSFTINKYNDKTDILKVETDTIADHNVSDQNIEEINLSERKSEELKLSKDKTNIKDLSELITYTNKTWQCPYCNRVLSRKTRQKMHYSTHLVKFSCQLCPYKTKIEPEFRKHETRHTLADQFVCDLCYFITNSRSNLNRHKRFLHK